VRSGEIELIGLDWGSTHVRAFAFDTNGLIVERARSNAGAMTLSSSEAFDAALVELVGSWQDSRASIPMIACGMVGARGAWTEAGYCRTDADAATLNAAMVSIVTSLGISLQVVPGIKSDAPDVMRGEETQIIGADIDNSVIVLPGTHSKWARVVDGKIAEFATFFTGEMNALLRNHSAIGKAISAQPNFADNEAIERGIKRAEMGSNWLNDLFAFRAQVVSASTSQASASTEMSAWLIASEFTQARAMGYREETIHVLASDTLMPWYQRVAQALEVEVKPLDGDETAARGLWRIAHA
jgi:2-dehydro-3-deoxygalactonokinase